MAPGQAFATSSKKKSTSQLDKLCEGGGEERASSKCSFVRGSRRKRRVGSLNFIVFTSFFPLFARADNEPSERLLGRGVNSDPFARNTLLVRTFLQHFFMCAVWKKAVLPGML